jgi:beta-phosphoglucomutase
MIEGLIFDMDGTMVDNMMVHHRAWQRKLASLGIGMTLAQVKEHIHGVNEEILERLFGDRFTPEERKRIAWEKEAEYREIFADQLTLIPGLEPFLMSVRTEGLSMAIGTAAPPENVDFVLDRLSLRPYFQAVVHARHVTKGKPDPQTFTMAAESMGIPTENCLVFEDSLAGAQTAKNAGCRAIIVTTTHHRDEFREFDHILRFITDYTELSLQEILSNST